MDCAEWSSERRAQYEEANKGWGFFRTYPTSLDKPIPLHLLFDVGVNLRLS